MKIEQQINELDYNYFRQIVKDAVSSLKKDNKAIVFSRQQANAVQKEFKEKLEVVLDDYIYHLTIKGAKK